MGKASFSSDSPGPVQEKLSNTATVLLSRDDFAASPPHIHCWTKAGTFVLSLGCVSVIEVSGFALSFTGALQKSPNLGVFHLMEMKPSQAASSFPAAAERLERLHQPRINPGCHTWRQPAQASVCSLMLLCVHAVVSHRLGCGCCCCVKETGCGFTSLLRAPYRKGCFLDVKSKGLFLSVAGWHYMSQCMWTCLGDLVEVLLSGLIKQKQRAK